MKFLNNPKLPQDLTSLSCKPPKFSRLSSLSSLQPPHLFLLTTLSLVSSLQPLHPPHCHLSLVSSLRYTPPPHFPLSPHTVEGLSPHIAAHSHRFGNQRTCEGEHRLDLIDLISEWMVSHNEFELSDSDYAVRIVLMTKDFGIDAAERYFEGLPLTAKTSETYTALLHSYAGAKLTEKAENLYERIKEFHLSLSALTYNEMMTMYMSLGQVEKVSIVVEDLKCHKVAPDIFTYNLWISSCAATLKIDQLRQILDEMRHDPGFGEGWERYINLANICSTKKNKKL